MNYLPAIGCDGSSGKPYSRPHDVTARDGRWRVTGRGIELLVARHDLGNPEALDYLEGRLREIGVIAELQRAGFEGGDEVVVGEVEFELDP